MIKLSQKAQSFISYAFLIAIVVAALVAMTNVIRYSLQGRFRQSADVFGQGEQFEPGVTQVEAISAIPLPLPEAEQSPQESEPSPGEPRQPPVESEPPPEEG